MPDTTIHVGVTSSELVERVERLEAEHGLSVVQWPKYWNGHDALCLEWKGDGMPVVMVRLDDYPNQEAAVAALVKAWETTRAPPNMIN